MIMAASLGGVVFVHRGLAGLVEGNLKTLIAFAVGVFGVLAYSLFEETLELGISVLHLFAAAMAGAIFLELAGRVIPKGHHHHETEHAHTHSRAEARHMLAGDAVHNVGDGFVLVAAFLADIRVGAAAAAAVFIHELTQEIAEFFVLREAGYTAKEALLRNFAVSSTVIVGILIALYASSVERLEAPLLAFAAGSFVYIILRDLVPSVIKTARVKGRVFEYVFAALLGALLMLGINFLTPHAHDEGGDSHDEHEVVLK